MLRDLRKDPDLVHALLGVTTKVAITINKAIQEAGRNIYPYPWDAMAEPNLIGVKGYEEFVWPYEKKLFKHLTPPGAVLGLSGDITNILEKEVETRALVIFVGFAGAVPAGVEREMRLLKKAKKTVGDRVTLLYDCANTAELLSGTPKEIQNVAEKAINIGAPSGGFILTAGVVPVDAPTRNCLAVMEAARTYGKYPISL
jgi:uroporphyrinogen decarboxylase